MPDLGFAPPGYSPSVLTLVVAGLAVLAVLAFAAVTVGAPVLARRGVSPLRPALVTGAALVVGVVALGLLVNQGKAEAEDRAATFAADEHAARGAATEAVEDAYGVRFPDGFLVTSVREASVPVEVTFSDGAAHECLLGTYGSVYELRCGVATWDEAEPLPAHHDDEDQDGEQS